MGNNIVADIAKAKCEVNSLVNKMINEYKFPSVVIEGIFTGVIADCRAQEISEIILSVQNESQEEK